MVKTMHDKTTADEPHQKRSKISQLFSEVANTTSRAAGRAFTFIVAAGIVLIWALTGPLFHYSDTWQLVINTGTTIVTFLMVFLIQNSQNRDGAAIQVKLDELIRVSKVQNTFIGIEHLTDEELDEIKEKCEQRAAVVEDGEDRDNAIDRTSRNAKRATDLAT